MRIVVNFNPAPARFRPEEKDVVASMNLVAGRGGNEKTKVRMLQESVGSIRQQLDIAVVRVKEQHEVKAESAPPESG